MDREETKEIMRTISRVYPDFLKGMEKSEKSEAIDIWTALFDAEPFELVAAGTKAFIVSDTKGFAPAPGQIKQKIRLLTHQEEQTETQAWEHVRKAIAGGRGDFREAWDKLPGEIKEIVSPGQLREWSITDLSQQQVIASNFMRSYRAKTRRDQEIAQLPEDVHNAIKRLQKGESHERITEQSK